ncbi:MAG: uroporphyrinogen-III synthase [Vicinamibacterales bacterium]
MPACAITCAGDNRPLFGRRVLVTRSREQAPDLVELLEFNGAEAVEAPVLRIAPPEDLTAMEQALAALRSFDWVVFTTTNAVDSVVGSLLTVARDLRALAGPSVCAVGPGTASRLHRVGITPDAQPSDHRSAGVVGAMNNGRPLAGSRVLLPVAEGGETLADDLRSAGADVTEVPAYRTITEEGDAHLGLYRQMLDRRIDAVTFTSGNTVRAFVDIYGTEQAPDLLAGTVVATIGPSAADAAAGAGIRVDVATEGATMAVLVDGLIRHFRPSST